MITDDRLDELLNDLFEACVMRAEIRELIQVYRQRENVALRDLVHQIEIGTFFDVHGHDAKMLKAYHDARAALGQPSLGEGE